MKRITIISGLIATLLFAVSAKAQSRVAADMYRVATQAMSSETSPADQFMLIDVFDAPLNESAKAYVHRNAKALADFDSASQIPFGDWGFDPDDTLYAGKSLSRASELADLVVLRARLRVAEKQYDDALNDCYEIALLSRRLSVQPSLTRQILQQKLYDEAMSAAGSMMLDAPADVVEKFLVHIDELRGPADSIDVTLAQEQVYLWFYQKIVEDPNVRAKFQGIAGPIANVYGLKSNEIDVSDLVADPVVAQQVFLDTETAFRQLIESLKTPEADRGTAIQSLVRRLHSSHALVRGAGEMALQAYQLSQMQVVQEQLLRAAAKMCAELPRPIDDEAAKKLAGAFEYSHATGGFELVGSISGGDQPVSVRVGPRTIRQQPATNPSQR